jgi:hypothetical protein
MLIGDKGRWWNREIRTAPFRLVTGGVLVALVLLGLFFQVGPDLLWGVTHHWTATWGGEGFRVPFGWRQQETSAGQHTIELRDSMHWGLSLSRPDRIRLRASDRTFDAGDMVIRWQRIQTRLMTPGDTLEPTPTDEFLTRHYRCSEILRSRGGEISVNCFDREGRWAVSARGNRGIVHDLSAVLKNLPSGEGTAQR